LKIHQELLPTFRQIRLTHHLPHGPLSLGIVRSNWSIAKGAEEALASEIAQHFTGKQYETRLSQYAHTEMASLKQKPVVCWPNSPISKLYAELTNEVFLNHNFIAQ
jgi:chromosome partitioning protein